ncbi:hypothetical protein HPB50_012314 [Hyalomma asiaticum]|uniref:Uncharacterized protein n=1 Tax=Hyalomma asiaticum TaxID=266040 RepID=A0ACB7TJ25_HYAAI|nr:hypothetical protein HPB50_012314 [Hyalomma asiaticum]
MQDPWPRQVSGTSGRQGKRRHENDAEEWPRCSIKPNYVTQLAVAVHKNEEDVTKAVFWGAAATPKAASRTLLVRGPMERDGHQQRQQGRRRRQEPSVQQCASGVSDEGGDHGTNVVPQLNELHAALMDGMEHNNAGFSE